MKFTNIRLIATDEGTLQVFAQDDATQSWERLQYPDNVRMVELVTISDPSEVDVAACDGEGLPLVQPRKGLDS